MLIVLQSHRNIKSLFPLKDKVAHWSCIIYEGQCSCKLSYIRKRKEKWSSLERASRYHWKVRSHKSLNGKCFSQAYLESIVGGTLHFCRRRIMEAVFIAIRKPALNDQLEHNFFLFCHGITLKVCSYCVTINDLLISFLSYHFVDASV